MLIVGAKGFAKEVLEVIHLTNRPEKIVFYDDVSADLPSLIYGLFPVIRNLEDAKYHFGTANNNFTIGIGDPIRRKMMYEKFIAIGGEFTSVISPFAHIAHFDTIIGKGCNIMTGSILSAGTILKEGVIVYFNTIVTHDCKIGKFVELSPGVKVLGRSSIGDFSRIGSNAVILPDISVGSNVTVGAGSVVTKDVPDNTLVVGVPAVFKKTLKNI